MRLIDADALLEKMKCRKDYVGRPSDPVCLVEDAPIIEGNAIQIEPLCEWLAKHYEPPYALSDIEELVIPPTHEQQVKIWMQAIRNLTKEET